MHRRKLNKTIIDKTFKICCFFIIMFINNIYSNCLEESFFENIDHSSIDCYSTETELKVVKQFNAMSNKQKICLYNFIVENCNKRDEISKCLSSIVFLSIVRDRGLIETAKLIEKRSEIDEIKAAIFIFYSVIGIKSNFFRNQYLKILDNNKNRTDDYFIIYAAIATRNRQIRNAILKRNYNLGYSESYLEGWICVMSWLDRDESWLNNKYYGFEKERLKVIRGTN